MVLFTAYDRTLNYELVLKNRDVEFDYPVETVNETSGSKIRIEINVDNKKYDWAGQVKTKQGSLDNLLGVKLVNVAVQ